MYAHPKADQSWLFTGRTDAEAEAPILRPDSLEKTEELTHWKRPWCSERLQAGGEGETTEDEVAGWHHWLDGHELEWTPGVGDGQGGLACCSPWGRRESDTTEPRNWTFVHPSVDGHWGVDRGSEGHSVVRGYMQIYSRSTELYSRDQHNIVKQWSLNKKLSLIF